MAVCRRPSAAGMFARRDGWLCRQSLHAGRGCGERGCRPARAACGAGPCRLRRDELGPRGDRRDGDDTGRSAAPRAGADRSVACRGGLGRRRRQAVAARLRPGGGLRVRRCAAAALGARRPDGRAGRLRPETGRAVAPAGNHRRRAGAAPPRNQARRARPAPRARARGAQAAPHDASGSRGTDGDRAARAGGGLQESGRAAARGGGQHGRRTHRGRPRRPVPAHQSGDGAPGRHVSTGRRPLAALGNLRPVLSRREDPDTVGAASAGARAARRRVDGRLRRVHPQRRASGRDPGEHQRAAAVRYGGRVEGRRDRVPRRDPDQGHRARAAGNGAPHAGTERRHANHGRQHQRRRGGRRRSRQAHPVQPQRGTHPGHRQDGHDARTAGRAVRRLLPRPGDAGGGARPAARARHPRRVVGRRGVLHPQSARSARRLHQRQRPAAA